MLVDGWRIMLVRAEALVGVELLDCMVVSEETVAVVGGCRCENC